MKLYKKLAKYYDLIYSGKPYQKEVDFIDKIIKKNRRGKEILEVACGTGNHTILLKKKGYKIIGFDLNKEMLKIARKKVRGVKFIPGDMKKLNLKKKFDIILCLFSSINYNKNYKELETTLKRFHKHLKEKGLLIFDLGFTPFKEGHSQIAQFQDKNIWIVRIDKSVSKNNIGYIKMAYIIYKNGKFSFDFDEHKLGLFQIKKVKHALKNIGFKILIYDNFTLKRNPKPKKPIFVCLK